MSEESAGQVSPGKSDGRAASVDSAPRAAKETPSQTIDPAADSPPQVFLDNRVIGWTFLAFVSIMGLSMVLAFIYFVYVSLAPPSFLEDYVKSRSDVPAQMTVTLEYESWTMRTMGVQIAFGFLVGLIFAGIGVLLFAAGANGALRLKGSAHWLPVSVSASAPGLAVLALGGIIIAMSVSKDVRRNMTAEMNLFGQDSGMEKAPTITSTKPHDPGGDPLDEPE